MVRRNVAAVIGLGLVVGVVVASVPRPAAAQNSSNPLQQVLNVLASFGDVTRSWSAALPANQRFVVLPAFNNEAVLDRNTGLVWERSPIRESNYWFGGQYSCLTATTGGQMGWRMPTISELSSLIDITATNPALPAGAPFDIGQQAFFWTATRRVFFDDIAWGVNVRDGAVDDYEFSLKASTWCVRGGTNSEEH